MSDFKLMTDSTSDLLPEIAEKFDIGVVPTDVTVGGETYLDFPDERELKKRDFYAMVRAGEMPKTAVINPERFINYFEPVLKDGFDILYLVFSSGLTTTMQNAMIAAGDLAEKYPDRTVTVVDTKSATLGEGMLVYHAAQKKAEGLSKEEIAAWVEKNRLKVCHWFTVDDLGYLKRGGRITGTAAAIGGVLNVKPVMHVNDDGKLEPVSKARGRKAAMEELLLRMKETGIDLANQTVFVSHGDAEEDCNWIVKEIKSRFGVKKVFTNFIGPVIGAHSGPGTLAVFFFGTQR